jgi:HSP20 family molecular chaperone IbpA
MRELMEATTAQLTTPEAKSGVFEGCPHHNEPSEAVLTQPRYHYQEQAATTKLVVHVPGADPAGIDIEVNVPDLTITAARNRSAPAPHHRSQAHDYHLRLRLGFNLAYEALQAELHGSTLTVTIPKKTAVR